MDDPRFKGSSLDELLSQYALNEALLQALQLEASDDATAYLPAYEVLRGALAASFAKQAGTARKPVKPMRSASDKKSELAYRAYVTFVKQARRLYGADLTIVGLPADVRAEAVELEVLGGEGVPANVAPYADPALRAYQMARLNLGRAKARCAALEYLAEQLPEGIQAGNPLDLALVGLYTCLSTRFTMHQSTVLKFALLLGGQPLEDTRQEIVCQTFGAGKRLSGYLTVDGLDCGALLPEEETALRASISKHAKRSVL